MTSPIFVYGTLRDEDVLSLALGPARARVTAVEAALPGHAALTAAAGPFPALRPMGGATAAGLLLSPGDADVRRRLDFFEGGFAYHLVPVTVRTAEGTVGAVVYAPEESVADTGVPWSLEGWQARDKPLFMEMAREVMATGPGGDTHPAQRKGVLRRAISRLAARAEKAPALLRSDFGGEGIAGHVVERLHSGFFALEEHRFRHRLFGGGMGPEVAREVFVQGDAVTVLPWDPVSDRVLLIEQVRAGLIARGDPNPWNLEVVAGLRDTPEPAEETARREAREEAALELGRLERVASYYSSPGSVTEYVTSFIAEADLGGREGGLHGLDHEHEDIRAIVIPREEAMAALDRGEARNAPLVVSLLALERARARLAADWAT